MIITPEIFYEFYKIFNMKYSTFRKIRLLVFIGIGVTILIVIFTVIPEKKQIAEENQRHIERTITEQPSDDMLTSIDRKIINLQKLSLEKNIDKSGKNYKKYKKYAEFIVDMRCDFSKGFSYWNRIKVDLDKDKNYDEKWTFSENGKIRKAVSSNDDELYDIEYELVNNTWIRR